jgi:hypothetical protein
MTADELLKVNLVTLCQQHVAQGPRRFEDVCAGALPVYFKGPTLKEESHRQFWAGNELLRDPVSFGATILAVRIGAPSSVFRTPRGANASAVLRPTRTRRIG